MNTTGKAQVATISMIAAQILMDRARALGMPATDFYEKSGISQPTWSRIFRGQGRLSLDETKQCAEMVGLGMSDVAVDLERAESVLRLNGVNIVEPVSPHHKDQLYEAGKAVIAVAALAFLLSQVVRK